MDRPRGGYGPRLPAHPAHPNDFPALHPFPPPKRREPDTGFGRAPEPAFKSRRHDRLKDAPPPVFHDDVQEKLRQIQEKGLMRPDELDPAIAHELADFAPEVAVELLNQFSGADMSSVRSKSAYLGGMMARFRRQKGPRLPLEVQQRLDNLYRNKQLKASDIDEKCYDCLRAAPPHIAVAALDRVASRDLRDVRNPSAFLMAQLRSAEQLANASMDPFAPAYGHMSRVNFAHEQAMLGVRIHEFHHLDRMAMCVPAPVALKLQMLWDAGNKLVSLLDDRSWETLADLPAPEGLMVVEQVAQGMARQGGLRNPNAFLMSVAGRILQHQRVAATSQSPWALEHTGPPPQGGDWLHGPETRAGYSGSAVMPHPAAYEPYGSRGARSRDAPGSDVDVHAAARGLSALDQLSEPLRSKVESILAAASSHMRPEHFDEGVVMSLTRLNLSSATQGCMDGLQASDCVWRRDVCNECMTAIQQVGHRTCCNKRTHKPARQPVHSYRYSNQDSYDVYNGGMY